ncbi:unnamed protein product, partial [Pylaiella littoralis]
FNQPTVRSAVTEDGTEEWVSDNGATHHTTGSSEHMYDMHPPPPRSSQIVVGSGTVLNVSAVGSLNLRFHMDNTMGTSGTT